MAMFYFFGFTIAVGVIINSTGLVINIINLMRRKSMARHCSRELGLLARSYFGGQLAW